MIDYVIVKLGLQNLVESYNIDRHTPLTYAIAAGALESVKHLAVQYRASVYPRLNNGETIFHIAAKSGQIAIINYFVNTYSPRFDHSLRAHIARGNAKGDHPIAVAISSQQYSLAKHLITTHNVLEAFFSPNDDGDNIFHIACKDGNVGFIRYLADISEVRRQFIEKENSAGQTPLGILVANGLVDAISLLTRKYKLNVKHTSDNGLNLLHIAAICGQNTAIDLLMSQFDFKSLIEKVDQNGLTPLAQAIANNQIKTAKLLITKYRANPLTTDNNNHNLTHIACHTDNTQLIDYLLGDL